MQKKDLKVGTWYLTRDGLPFLLKRLPTGALDKCEGRYGPFPRPFSRTPPVAPDKLEPTDDRVVRLPPRDLMCEYNQATYDSLVRTYEKVKRADDERHHNEDRCAYLVQLLARRTGDEGITGRITGASLSLHLCSISNLEKLIELLEGTETEEKA